MPSPDRMYTTLLRAGEAVRATPGRRGHLIHPQACTELFVVGDLHGHVGNFQAVWKLADLAAHPGRHLVLQELIHGKFNYPGGGDKSHQLVDLFAAVKCQYPVRVHYLPGNHEMGQWTGRKIQKGDCDLNEQFRRGVIAAYGAPAMPDIYRAYCDLWQACPLSLRTANHVFVSHSLIPGRHLPLFDAKLLEAESYEPKDLEPGGYAYGMVWGRETALETVEEFLRKVDCDLLVTGHLPADQGFLAPNPRQIALDCSDTPGGYVLFPTDREVTQAELLGGVGLV